MKCPFCSHVELKVTDSRDASELNGVKRRRECLKCQQRFTTFETIELTMQVKKRDGRYEEFQQEKLLKGLELACRHSRISHEEMRALAYKITTKLMEQGANVMNTTEIGEMVMGQLQKMDPVAYIRFACVYRRFKDVDELVNAIEKCSETI
jgi:transcriptional repressor NrdR